MSTQNNQEIPSILLGKRRTDVLASLELGVLLARKDTEGVSTEVVTLWTMPVRGRSYHLRHIVTHLALQQVGGQDLAAVTVEEREGSAEGRKGNAPDDGLGHDAPPAGLRLVDGLVEEVIEEQRLKVLGLLVCGGDVTEEDRLDDATTTPHLSNAGVVEVPAKLQQ